jgi:hypothetical protein
MKVEANKTYIGVVEDNNDPLRIGRVKVRVLDVFDDLKIEDIPFASPWKDLNGNQFNVPEKGKVLLVVFDSGDEHKPEFISADHYNVNLEKKLTSLSETDYASMKSLIFDHKTQIYVNDSEGLKLDHKYNNINITENGIDLNLKDNNLSINIGDSTATQQAILGNRWMDWFDEFVEALMGSPYAAQGSPVQVLPTLTKVLLKYKESRDPVFLSQHINLVDNNKVSTVKNTEREDNAQLGDAWNSTKVTNNLTSVVSDNFKPVDGPRPEYDDTYVAPPSDGSPDDVSRENTNPANLPLSDPASNKEIDRLIRFMKSKGYVVYDKIGLLNIVGMRNKKGNTVTNKFDDSIKVFYKNKNGNWDLFEYIITTTPGFIPKTNKLPSNVAILALGQYVDQYKLGKHLGREDHTCLKNSVNVVHRNDREDLYNYKSKTQKGSFGINIHRSSKTGSSDNVNNWSEGCQVFKNVNQFNQFIKLCNNQVSLTSKSTFTYTLCDYNEFSNYL